MKHQIETVVTVIQGGSKISRVGIGSFAALSIIFFIWVAVIPSALGWEQWRGDKVHSAYVQGEPPEKGDLIWSHRTGDQVLSSAVFYQEGLIIGSDDGWLYCFEHSSGDIRWKFRTEGSVQATALIHGGRAYFGSFDHFLYCIDLPPEGESPELAWRYDSGAQIISSAHVHRGNILFCDLQGRMHSVTTEGNLNWVTDLSAKEIWATPVVDAERNLAYVGDTGNCLYAVDLNNGTVMRTMFHSDKCEIYSSGTLVDDTLYYTTGMERTIYSLDVESWSHLWAFKIDHDTYSTPVVRDDCVYFGSFEFSWCVPAEDPDGDGNITEDEVLWSSPTHDYQGGSSPLVVDGKFYIGSDDHRVYCFDSETGEEILTFETKGYVYSSPVLHNGSVYFGSSDRSVYCIGDRPPGLTVTISAEPEEITSDGTAEVKVDVTDNDGMPIPGAEVTFSVSAGNIAFDQEGNTRLVHSTDENGTLRVIYFPVTVSSRSTVTIEVHAERQGLQDGTSSAELVVEPGENVEDPVPDIGKDESERSMHIAVVTALAVINILMAGVAVVFFIRNKNEAKEVNQL
ncbi:MAG: PQQ-binding-like beta-propeller repeat protein [Thermoplasmatota archaeon]